MKKIILGMINFVAITYLAGSDCDQNNSKELSKPVALPLGFMKNQSPEEKWRTIMNSYIKIKTSFSALGIHDIIERTKLDINLKDKDGLTAMELAQKEGNEIAVTYFLLRNAKDTNPERAKTLREKLTQMMDDHSKKNPPKASSVINPLEISMEYISFPNEMSPQISNHSEPKRLKESPRRDDDDDDD